MKRVRDLRPCDNCAGPIAPFFYIVRVSLAFIRADAVNQFVGMHRFFGGRASAALVENFAPAHANALTIAGDEDPELMTELVICQTCYLDNSIDLARLTEWRNEAQKAKEVTTAMADETKQDQPVGDQVSDQADGASSEKPAEEQPIESTDNASEKTE